MKPRETGDVGDRVKGLKRKARRDGKSEWRWRESKGQDSEGKEGQDG